MKDPARWLLGFTGYGTLITGAVATFMHEPAAPDVALILSGVGMAAMANLQPVIESLRIDKSGVEFKLRTGEKNIREGNVVDADLGVKAVDLAFQTTAGLTMEPRITMDAQWIPTNFKLTQEAVSDLMRLNSRDRAAVQEQLPTLNGDDPRAVQPQSGGQSYHVRFIRQDLRIYYRLLDPPDKWIVVAIGE
jgi:mRNA-degrading endonuclease RelE of RelBE toxin-antitoxin system